MKESGTQFFKTEEEMDTFLEDLQPGSTVVIKEWHNDGQDFAVDEFQATWFPGKNMTDNEYYPNGIGGDDGEIYWFGHDKLWYLIPAF